jgi:hypothetical protein
MLKLKFKFEKFKGPKRLFGRTIFKEEPGYHGSTTKNP